nr:MAG TPA: hypothetical protein [Caudoviricetes sp.]
MSPHYRESHFVTPLLINHGFNISRRFALVVETTTLIQGDGVTHIFAGKLFDIFVE